MIEQLKKEIEADEGRITAVYADHLGIKTAGVGHMLIKDVDPEYDWPLGAPVTHERIEEWFDADVNIAINDARWHLDSFDTLPEEVQLIVCNMAFNLGGPRFGGFKNMLRAIDQDRDWTEAARQMADSKWHRQVQNRSGRLIERMLKVEA